MMPDMPVWAYIAMILGGINMGLWKSGVRYLGMLPVLIGAVAMLASPRPDILVTGDGKHLAFAEQDGRVTLLRGNAGEYIKDMLLESVGTLADPLPIERWPGATCSPDICIIDVKRQDRNKPRRLGILGMDDNGKAKHSRFDIHQFGTLWASPRQPDVGCRSARGRFVPVSDR